MLIGKQFTTIGNWNEGHKIKSSLPLKHCIHFLRSSRWPPTSNILREKSKTNNVSWQLIWTRLFYFFYFSLQVSSFHPNYFVFGQKQQGFSSRVFIARTTKQATSQDVEQGENVCKQMRFMTVFRSKINLIKLPRENNHILQLHLNKVNYIYISALEKSSMLNGWD